MEKLFLAVLLTSRKLNVIDQNQIAAITILVSKFIHLLGFESFDQLIHKLLSREIGNASPWVSRFNMVGNGMEEVGLTQTRRSIKEKGVVVLSRLLRDGNCGSVGKLVTGANNERGEGMVRIDSILAWEGQNR